MRRELRSFASHLLSRMSSFSQDFNTRQLRKSCDSLLPAPLPPFRIFVSSVRAPSLRFCRSSFALGYHRIICLLPIQFTFPSFQALYYVPGSLSRIFLISRFCRGQNALLIIASIAALLYRKSLPNRQRAETHSPASFTADYSQRRISCVYDGLTHGTAFVTQGDRRSRLRVVVIRRILYGRACVTRSRGNLPSTHEVRSDSPHSALLRSA